MPESVQDEVGHDLFLVQMGRDPRNWKPMPTVGAGVREIRGRDTAGAFHAIYVANIGAQVLVLHCFQKKSQKTSQKDLALATQRFSEATRVLR